jgi:hypothetical protein
MRFLQEKWGNLTTPREEEAAGGRNVHRVRWTFVEKECGLMAGGTI